MAHPSERKRLDRIGWRLAGVGTEFATHVIAGVLLGWGIDWYFEVGPWGIVGGTSAGVAVGMLQFIRRSLALNKEMGAVKAPPGGWQKIEDEPEEGVDERDEGSPPDAARRPEPRR
ncbi:MAG: AtpZ/AtpI family protein [Phycisphaerae bacterium]|nr:AtpZ/AtpI family protein [Phycisphaerae bacterium]